MPYFIMTQKQVNKWKHEMSEPILRDAETKDMKSIIHLVEKLIDYELKISDIPIIEDLQKKSKIIYGKI